jgi:adenylate cyclase class 2
VIEREIKIPVDELNPIRRHLDDAGARQIQPETREINHLLDTPDGVLQTSGTVLRVRRTGERAVLTFKGPARYHDAVKERLEIELDVVSAEGGLELFRALGYTPWIQYEKDRESWVMGDVRVDLDHTPMGNFVEIEGPEGSLATTARALELDPTAAVAGSYISLWQAYRQAHPELETGRDMVFTR